ncbi:unnamed protein product [Pocillopora meandrina]|uniref:Ubiquitin-like protease family profile domain-containing protein n=1 Tax=Pocillopora meandrina TaxID=46732 RepID=A0AAU9WPN4_9CNID|nr:unnamed protein product [Pocillopora meandrina]
MLIESPQTRLKKQANNPSTPKKRNFEKEIGYRIHRQGHMTPKTRGSEEVATPRSRWKHTSPPGWRDKPTCTRNDLSSQVSNAHNDGKCNGSDPEVLTRANMQKECSSLVEEQKHSHSILDSLMGSQCKGNQSSTNSNGEVSISNDTDSDNNLRKKTKLDKSANLTNDLLSDENYEDCFKDYFCAKCSTKLSQNRNCSHCSKDNFPSQAATPRKPLSPDRFYNVYDSKHPNVQRTYGRQRRDGTPKLLQKGSVRTVTSAKESSNEECQTNVTAKKRKNQPKLSSEDSDSESKVQAKRKRNTRQSKVIAPKKVDVITLSDEEEVIETEAKLVVEQSDISLKELSSSSDTVVSESPINQDKEIALESGYMSTSVCSDTSSKGKTSPEREGNAQKKSENFQPYVRDDGEIEIMLGQNVWIGTLACNSTKPLKITRCDDEISFGIVIGDKNHEVTIVENDFSSLKVYPSSNPGLIVLGVTAGYALKLRERIDHSRGAFLNPGSAVTAERDIVLELSEHVKPEVTADLDDWVTEKLSKEFSQLSLEEAERIRTYKTQSQKHQKSPVATHDGGSRSAIATRSKTYNTRTNSDKKPAVAAQTLIVYPRPPQPGGITVTTEDVACLAPGELLNDVIIDFYLKYIFFEKLSPADRERTHILSSFFYKRLTQRSTSGSSNTSTSTSDRMHSQVRTWTKNVDIFEKDFVVVPINESSHWYLAVICFPGKDGQTLVNEINDEDDGSDSKNEDHDIKTGEEAKNGRDNDDDVFLLRSPFAKDRKKSPKQNQSKSLSKQIITSRPCILVFDSLGLTRSRCLFNLRNYLQCEWRERKKEPKTKSFDKDAVKGNHPKVPGQDNHFDCGVYVCQYVESFFTDPITDFSLPIKKPDWFSSIQDKREEIRKLIYTLKTSAEVDNVT